VLEVFYLQIVNGESAWRRGCSCLIPPMRWGGDFCSNAQRADRPRLIVTEPLRLNDDGAGCHNLPYGGDSVTIERNLPVTLGRCPRGERSGSTSSTADVEPRQVPSEGRTFLVGSGRSTGGTLAFPISASRRASWPRWTALVLAVVVLASGAWASLSIGGKASAAADRRRALQERRDRLFADLVRIEQEHRAGGLDDARYAVRRRDLVAQLERIYGELDQGMAA
jgi:hypothetical protein